MGSSPEAERNDEAPLLAVPLDRRLEVINHVAANGLALLDLNWLVQEERVPIDAKIPALAAGLDAVTNPKVSKATLLEDVAQIGIVKEAAHQCGESL